MPVSGEYIEYVVDQLACIGEVTHKRMFGGVGLYHDGLFFGLIASDMLYFKVDDENRSAYQSAGSKPFQPYDEVSSMNYFEVPPDVLENREELVAWANRAIQVAATRTKNRQRD